jgi:hypothetical protein
MPPNKHIIIAAFIKQDYITQGFIILSKLYIKPLTPNDTYSGRTAPLTSKSCILYIYSINTGTEYFKHGVHSPSFPS